MTSWVQIQQSNFLYSLKFNLAAIHYLSRPCIILLRLESYVESDNFEMSFAEQGSSCSNSIMGVHRGGGARGGGKKGQCASLQFKSLLQAWNFLLVLAILKTALTPIHQTFLAKYQLNYQTFFAPYIITVIIHT